MMQELNYIRCGDYYIPDIRLPEENRPIGRWGRMHRDYIKEHNPIRFNDLCLSGELWTYLADLNEQAQNRLEIIIEQMKAAEGVTEDMKQHDQMAWVRAMVNGKLSEARFQMLSDDYEQEQADLRAEIEMLENEIQNQEDQAENVDRFIRQAKKYLYLEKLTPTILNDMVNAVYVHAPDKSSGHRVQDVTISYNYIGILPANLLYDVMNGKAA